MLPRLTSPAPSWTTLPNRWPRPAVVSAPRRAAARWAASGRLCWCCAGFESAAVCTAWPGTPASVATGYRCLHEGIDVLAEPAPDLHEVLRRCHDEGIGHVICDGTLIACDRVAGIGAASNDL